MPDWMKDLTKAWPMISANWPTFLFILFVMAGTSLRERSCARRWAAPCADPVG
jgi:hypothetical protein